MCFFLCFPSPPPPLPMLSGFAPALFFRHDMFRLCVLAGNWGVCVCAGMELTFQRLALLLPELVPRVHLGQRPGGLAEHDGRGGVVLLHGGVRPGEEGSVCVCVAGCDWWLACASSTKGKAGGGGEVGRELKAHLVAALCSEVWQKRKRTSLRDFANAYLVAMAAVQCNWVGGGEQNPAGCGGWASSM